MSKNRIALFYMSGHKYGGFPTFTSHLCRAYRMYGFDADIYKVRTRTEKKGRDFLDGLKYNNLSLDDAIDMARNVPTLITCTDYKKNNSDIVPMLENGAEVVIHDWTEMNNGFADVLCEMEIHPIVIRTPNVKMLANYGLDAVYIPHPYVSINPKKRHRHTRAIALARLDWDKQTHMIVEANERLSPRNKIYMWGSNHNRMYLYNAILGKFDGWEGKQYTGPYYMGPFPGIPGFAVFLASNSDFVVDMSVIKGDGGGTQYTFLEAIDAGAVLVLHSNWMLPGGEFEDERNCLTVDTVDGLVDLIDNTIRNDCLDIVESAADILQAHSTKVIVPQYVEFMEHGA